MCRRLSLCLSDTANLEEIKFIAGLLGARAAAIAGNVGY